MAETFLTGIAIGFLLGLFVYWGFLINIHLHVSSIVMTEVLLRRIAYTAQKKGTIYYKNIDSLINEAVRGLITFHDENNSFTFDNPKVLCQQMMERQVLVFGNFFTTLLLLIGVKRGNSLTGKK